MFRTCADLLETSKNRQTQCCFSQIHRFLIYHFYSTAIYFCNFLKASIDYEEYILLVTKDFKLGGDNVKFCFNILFTFLKYNTWKKKLAEFLNFHNLFKYLFQCINVIYQIFSSCMENYPVNLEVSFKACLYLSQNNVTCGSWIVYDYNFFLFGKLRFVNIT